MCEYPNMFVYVFSCSPGGIDPDYIQVAEVVALRVQQVAAGTALGPLSVCWDTVSSLHFQLFHHWKTQT